MIGVFDIGVGGLSVVKAMLKIIPKYQILYFGDIGRLPYSSKAPEVRIQYSIQDADFVVKRGAQILVIACNTITAIAGEKIREIFSLPTFDVIEAGVKTALYTTRNKRIGIIGSKVLAENPVYPDLLKRMDPEIETISKACQLFVYLVEENCLGQPETFAIARNYLAEIRDFGIDTLILGCTHFPLMRDEIQAAVGGQVSLVDPAVEISRQIKAFLLDHTDIEERLSRREDHRFYISGGSADDFRKIVRRYLNREINHIEKIDWDELT